MARRFPVEVREGSMAHWSMRLAGLLLVAAMVLWLPSSLETFRLNQVTEGLIYAIAIVGLNLLSGFAGQISLGHAAFFGLGAYTTGVLIEHHEWSAARTMPVVVGLCFVVGVVVGIPALRIRGMYLAVVTLVVGVLFPSLVRRFESVTGGSLGLKGLEFEPPEVEYFAGREGEAKWLYWVTIALLLVIYVCVANIMRGPTGRAVTALRDNEVAATVMGINRAYVRTVVFGLSAAIAGVAGSLFAVKIGIITPESFTLILSINFLVAMVLGGKATLAGPILGGLAIYFIPYWTSNVGNGVMSGVLLGATLIVFIFVLPSGVVGGWRSAARRVVRISAVVPVPDIEPASPPDEPPPGAVPSSASDPPQASDAVPVAASTIRSEEDRHVVNHHH